MRWGLLVAIACTLASMVLGWYVGLRTEGFTDWYIWLGPAHATCVFGCLGYARRWVWAAGAATLSILFPIWGLWTLMVGYMIAPFPGWVSGFETPLFAHDIGTFMVTSMIWTLFLSRAFGDWTLLLRGLIAPIGACVAMYFVERPTPDTAAMYGLPIAVWHILMPPAIFFSAVRARGARGRLSEGE